VILGHTQPAATTLVDAYTAAAPAVVKIVAANRAAATEFRIALAPLGAADAADHYVVYDKPIEANDALVSAAVDLETGDVVRVRSTSGSVVFQVNGIEV